MYDLSDAVMSAGPLRSDAIRESGDGTGLAAPHLHSASGSSLGPGCRPKGASMEAGRDAMGTTAGNIDEHRRSSNKAAPYFRRPLLPPMNRSTAGVVSGAVCGWGDAAEVGGRVRSDGGGQLDSIWPECDWRVTAVNREDRELLAELGRVKLGCSTAGHEDNGRKCDGYG